MASKVATIMVTLFSVCVALYALYGETNVFDMVVYAWAVMGTGFGPLLTMVLLGKQPNQVVSLAMILFGAGFTVALSMLGVPEPEYFIPGLSSGFVIYYIGAFIYPETREVVEVL